MMHPLGPATTTTDMMPPRVQQEPAAEQRAPAPVLEAKQVPEGNRAAPVKRGWRAIDAPVRAEAAEVGSRFLYVAEQGTVVRRAGTRVVVTKKDATLLEVPAVRLQGVLLYGNVQVSTQCLRNLLAEGVFVSVFSRNGRYRGRVQPPAERGGRLRRRQWARSSEEAFCLEFAKAVVRGKILAQRRVAEAYAKNRAAESLGTGQAVLRESLARVGEAADLAALRGVEGSASRAYFGLFKRWNSSDLPFEGREKRGTSDPVNALLNLGYTLLTRELEGLIEAAGLDPTIGFYHAPDDDRPSLACDWVEEFRHVVVDRLVLTLVNKRMVKQEHFEEGEDRRGIRLTADGLRTFFVAYESAMRRPAGDDHAVATVGLRAVMLAQLARLLDAIAGRSAYRTHLEPEVVGTEPAVAGALAATAAP